MRKERGNLKIKGVVMALLVVSAGIVYLSFSKLTSKSMAAIKEPVIVSENMTNIQKEEDDNPLQLVKIESDEINGLQNIVGLSGDNEAIVKIGISAKEFEEAYEKCDHSNKEQEASFQKKIRGELFKLNMYTLQKQPFKLQGGSEKYFDESNINFSPDKTKYIYYVDPTDNDDKSKQGYYIYDIKNNISKKTSIDGKMYGSWTKDGKHIVGINYNENQSIFCYDVQSDKKSDFSIEKSKVNPNHVFYSENGKDIYFVGSTENKSQKRTEIAESIYKFSIDNENLESIMSLPSVNILEKSRKNHIVSHNFRIIKDGKKIVFAGNVNEENGLFIYNVDTKKINTVVKAEPKTIPVPFWISPDENKIIYAEYKKDGTTGTMYTAKIKEDKLINKVLVCNDLLRFEPLQNYVWWSNDSKKITMFEVKKVINLDYYRFIEKAAVRNIYLK